MKSNKLLAFFALSAYCSFAIANPFPFRGITILPKKSADLVIGRGYHQDGMRITCEAYNPNFDRKYPAFIKVFSEKKQQIKLSKEYTLIEFYHTHRNIEPDDLAYGVQNLHETDTISLVNCKSEYI